MYLLATCPGMTSRLTKTGASTAFQLYPVLSAYDRIYSEGRPYVLNLPMGRIATAVHSILTVPVRVGSSATRIGGSELSYLATPFR